MMENRGESIASFVSFNLFLCIVRRAQNTCIHPGKIKGRIFDQKFDRFYFYNYFNILRKFSLLAPPSQNN